MAQQLCACADLDWSQIRLPHPEHHPDCTFRPLKLEWCYPVIRSVADLRSMMEKRVGAIGPLGTSSLAPTGEPFVTFSIGGVVEEGELFPLVATSHKAGLVHFWLSYCAYVHLLTGGDTASFVLYWRELPSIVTQDGYYVVQARLLVSDRPLVQP